jgi:ankyrin repeat protein
VIRLALVLLPAFLVLSSCGGELPVDHTDRRTPLERAAAEGSVDRVMQLLASGADPNAHGGTWTYPLEAAAERPHNTEVIRALIAAGANPNTEGVEDYEGWDSPLFRAVVIEDVDNARALLDGGASVKSYHLTNTAHLTPEIMQLLVARGLDLFQVDNYGRNLLHLMLQWDPGPKPELVDYLIRAGVPINERDDEGKTPLAYWKEPRSFELHPFWSFLTEHFSNNETVRNDRQIRAKISGLMERSGARL